MDDQVSTLRKKGVSATVVGTNSEANSLIRRGMYYVLASLKQSRNRTWNQLSGCPGTILAAEFATRGAACCVVGVNAPNCGSTAALD